jgi:hypothetical protein
LLPDDAAEFFRRGSKAVEIKLGRCEKACREIALDDTLIVEPAHWCIE